MSRRKHRRTNPYPTRFRLAQRLLTLERLTDSQLANLCARHVSKEKVACATREDQLQWMTRLATAVDMVECEFSLKSMWGNSEHFMNMYMAYGPPSVVDPGQLPRVWNQPFVPPAPPKHEYPLDAPMRSFRVFLHVRDSTECQSHGVAYGVCVPIHNWITGGTVWKTTLPRIVSMWSNEPVHRSWPVVFCKDLWVVTDDPSDETRFITDTFRGNEEGFQDGNTWIHVGDPVVLPHQIGPCLQEPFHGIQGLVSLVCAYAQPFIGMESLPSGITNCPALSETADTVRWTPLHKLEYTCGCWRCRLTL